MKRFFAVLLAAMLLISAFAGCSSEKAPEENGGESPVAIKIGEMEFTVEDMNCMYISAFNEIYTDLYYTYASYGIDVSQIMDVSKPLEDQMAGENVSWHDNILTLAKDSATTIVGVYEKAISEGFVLSEEQKKDIDSFDEQIEAFAAENGMTVDEYLFFNYGEDVSIESLKKVTEIQIFANAYLQDCNEKIEVSEEDIEAYYKANKKDIDTVDFRYYSSFYGEAEEGEEALSQEEAEAQANALAEVHTGEEFNALAKEYTKDEEHKKLFDEGDATLLAGAGYTATGIDEVSEWLFDEARTAGETMVYHDEEYQSYLTVMFEERVDPDYDYVNVRHILIMPEEDENGNKSEEAWAEAEKKASEIYESYLAGEQTEEAFSALAVENSQDGNAAQGGIYQNVKKGKMVTEFNDWCFDEARVTGDNGIVKTQFGYHIMYFVGIGDNNLQSTIKPAVTQERMAALIAECKASVSVEETEEMANVGGMIDDIVNAANEAAGNEPTAEEEKEVKSYTGIIIGVLIAIIVVCIIIIIKNVKKKPEQEEMTEPEETEESVLEATDEDLTEEELLAEEAFEENPSEEEAEEVSEETEE